MKAKLGIILFLIVGVWACQHEVMTSGPTPFVLDIPNNFPPMAIPEDNPLTVEGVELGRHLFYEELLSGDNSISCASCHSPAVAFSDDGNQFSVGIDGIAGKRNSMALMNLGWDNFYFWDGRAATLEDQILQPVTDPIEMHDTWQNVSTELEQVPMYQRMFLEAFETTDIDSLLVAKAIAQFLRTMISGNSRFDQAQRFETSLTLDEQLALGQLWDVEAGSILDTTIVNGQVFVGAGGADCFHCHPTTNGLLTDGQLHNNGLDSVFTDLGAGGFNGLASDMGRFKTPTLKNIALTAPYMHDGRFNTLEEVIDHYNNGGHFSSTVDPFMKFTDPNSTMDLSQAKKDQLLALLNSFTDWDFVNNPDFQDPNP